VSYIKLEGADSTGNDMFVVYSATVAQLKAICSALPECEGFNSEGWVKSRVVNKRRAAINLYLKQTAIITPQPGEVVQDHSAGLFQRHLDDYDTMEHDLRMYPHSHASRTHSDSPYIPAVEPACQSLFNLPLYSSRLTLSLCSLLPPCQTGQNRVLSISNCVTILPLCISVCRYVYETTTGLNMPSYDDYKYGVEHLFISLLAKSKFRTRVCTLLS